MLSPARAQVITNVSTAAELATAMFEGNNIMPVPEPSTYALLALAAAALGVRLWRRRAGKFS